MKKAPKEESTFVECNRKEKKTAPKYISIVISLRTESIEFLHISEDSKMERFEYAELK